MELKYNVSSEDTGKTVKYILKQRMGISEKLVKKLKSSGQIFCNDLSVFVNKIVNDDDIVLIRIEFEDTNEDIIPENLPLDILYEDDSLLVINKQANTVVHPTWNHQSGTVANAVMHHLLSKGIKTRIRPVSRLDRDTTGIIIFALNQFVQEALIRQMKDNTFVKEYIGIVHGIMEADTGIINLPIERKPDSIMLRHTSPLGAPSVTRYEVIKLLKGATLLKFILETGRTHQIRVHCQAIGHPLIGDTLYPHLSEDNSVSLINQIKNSDNNSDDWDTILNNEIIKRQALHSRLVSFIHPVSGKTLVISAPIPKDMKNAVIILNKK